MELNKKTLRFEYALYLIISYLFFSYKFKTINLFQFLKHDYFNLNLKLLDFWTGLNYHTLPFLHNYAFIDLTYTKNSVLNNMGLPISFIYSVLGSYAYGPVLLVIVTFFFIIGARKISEYHKTNFLKFLPIFILFIPISNLLGSYFYTGEIGLLYALTLILWGYYWNLKNRVILSTVFFILACFCRVEIFVIGIFFALFDFKKNKIPSLLITTSIIVLYLRNYLATDVPISLGDNVGRLHDGIIHYLEEINNPSIREIFERLLFHLKLLVLSTPNVFETEYINRLKFVFDSPLNMLGFYFWIFLFVKKDILKSIPLKIYLSSLLLFIYIAGVSEAFYIRYATVYLFLPLLLLSVHLSLNLQGRKFYYFILLQLVSFSIFSSSYKPLILRGDFLSNRSISQKIINHDQITESFGGKIENNYSCTDISDVHFQGIKKQEKICYFDSLFVSALSAQKSKCDFELISSGLIQCEKLSYSDNFGNTGKMIARDERTCFTQHEYSKAVVIFQISNLEFPEKSVELSEIKFDCR